MLVRHQIRSLREQVLEIWNYVYPIVSSEYITFSVDHYVLYVFAAFWSIFGRLPSVVFFLSVLLCVVIYLRRLLSVTIGRQANPRCPAWFLVLMLVCDFLVVAAVCTVAGFLGIMRSLTAVSHLASHYGPTESLDPIWWREVFGPVGGFDFKFRVDLISAVFVVVTVVVFGICFVFYELGNSPHLAACGLVLKASACCAFCAANVFTFIVFMEVSAVFMLFIICQARSGKRLQAGLTYFVYSSISGILLLVVLSVLATRAMPCDFELIGEGRAGESPAPTACIFLFIVAILVKIPTGPFYHWLLKAHVEASTAGSIILAAVMLKIPACALLRLLISFGYRLDSTCVILLLTCAVFAGISCTSQMWHETDMKRIVALASVVHMSGSILIISLSELVDCTISIPTVLMLLVAHSFSSACMFALCGVVSSRYHTRDFTQISGLFQAMPRAAVAFVLGVFFTGAFPVGAVFISEVYAASTFILVGQIPLIYFLLIIYSFVFWRLLWVYLSVTPGSSCRSVVPADLTLRESLILGLLFVVLVLLAAYGLELGSALMVVPVAKLAARPASRRYIRLHAIALRRIKFSRGFRWLHAVTEVKPERNYVLPLERPNVRRRRQVLYVLNALKFRDKFDFLGRGAAYSAAPIKPKLDPSWSWLMDNIEPEAVPYLSRFYMSRNSLTKENCDAVKAANRNFYRAVKKFEKSE